LYQTGKLLVSGATKRSPPGRGRGWLMLRAQALQTVALAKVWLRAQALQTVALAKVWRRIKM